VFDKRNNSNDELNSVTEYWLGRFFIQMGDVLMPERYDNHHAIVTSHPYRQLFRHNIKYPAKRYDRHEIYNERRDGTLVRVFDGKACWYGGYEEDSDP